MNKGLNKGIAKKQENKRLCRELLKKGRTQREIAKLLGVSLQTTNSYCQEIAKEIEDARKKAEEKEQKAEELHKARIKNLKRNKQTEPMIEEISKAKTPEEIAKDGFTACLMELKLRLPTMTNEEVMKITVDLWDRVNK